MKRKLPRKILVWLLLACMLFSMTACDLVPEPVESESEAVSESEPEKSVPAFLNPLPIPTEASRAGIVDTGLRYKVQEKYKLNDESIGWIELPNSELSDVVMYHKPANKKDDEKFFYLRRDFNKVPNTGPLAAQYGTYFADYRSTFGGGRQGMSRNTTIYGHSMEDNPDGAGFSQLKKFLDEEFARENPYLYFSTAEEDMAWEVFAVFYATRYLVYNKPDEPDEDFLAMIAECEARSIYDYGIEITPEDKIITLSTCCYNFGAGYPNDYRYVVMAKLVKPGQHLKEDTTFTKNPSPKAP